MEASGGHDVWRQQEECREKEQAECVLEDIEVPGQGNLYMQGDMEAQETFADVMHSLQHKEMQQECCVLETGVQQKDSLIEKINGQLEDVVFVDKVLPQENTVLAVTVVQGQQDVGESQRLSEVHSQQVCEDKLIKLQKWTEVREQIELIEGSLHRGEVTGDKQQEKAAGGCKDFVHRTQNHQDITGEVLEREHLLKKCSVTGSQLFTADTSTEAQDLENSIEEMLIRLDEFCAMMDMIRNETSVIIEEEIPAIELRVKEMNKIYCRVDKLEAFVKMVAHHVSFLEEEVIRAERSNLSFPQSVNRLFTGAPIPLFRFKHFKKKSSYELPALYRTEDYFPGS